MRHAQHDIIVKVNLMRDAQHDIIVKILINRLI